jgi:coenzyme F420-reducing hydrogenase delta subunit/ferredoxin
MSDAPAFEPLVTAFVCNWCTYTGADLAGTSRLQMDENVRIVRLPCTGRIDPLLVVKAFERGSDGVIVSGCHPGDCHYHTGNYHARRRFAVFRELMLLFGFEPERLTFSWVSASEGGKWQEVVNTTTARLRRLGPFAGYRQLDAAELGGLDAVRRASPRLPPAAWSASDELRELAEGLLAEKKVDVVSGWGEGRREVRPELVTRPEDVRRLVADHRCVHNLSVYLDPRRSHVRELGRAAVVVKGCDARTVAGLLREHQLTREEVVLIGVRCGGVWEDAGDSESGLADRCAGCDMQAPELADHLVGAPQERAQATSRVAADVAAVMSMSPQERWAFWSNELGRCVRCNACRAVCPLCYCSRCVADKSRPQWVEPSPHLRGNLAWHLTRALHLAGRCGGCGECARACPVGIPLELIQHRVAQVVKERFSYQASDDPEIPAPIGAFDRNDPQEFIL